MTGGTGVKNQECIESMTAEKYLLGELSAVERDQFEDHFFECPECAEAVRDLSNLREGARAEFRQAQAAAPAAAPAAVQSPAGWLQRLRAWFLCPQSAVAFAGLALAAVTGVQNLQMRALLQPQILRSVALQPATRGNIQGLSSAADGAFVLLEADLPGAGGNVTWSVRTAQGETAMNGAGQAPDPGLSFKILVPAARLDPGEYTLAVRSDTCRVPHDCNWHFRFRSATH
jgi:hypothetical protein